MIKRRLIKLVDTFKGINDTRRSDGWNAAISQAITVVMELFFFKTRSILFVRSLEDPFVDIDIDQDMTIRELRVQELTLFEVAVERSDIEWYRSLLRRGRICLIALKDGQLAAYIWLTTKIDPHSERVYVPLAPDDAYVVEIRTLPAFQRQGFQKVLLKHAIVWAKEQGCSRLISTTGVDNEASSNLHNKFGYRQVSCITRTKILVLLNVRYDPNPFGKAGNVWMLY